MGLPQLEKKNVYGQLTTMKRSHVMFCVIIVLAMTLFFFNFPFQDLQNGKNLKVLISGVVRCFELAIIL